MDRDRASAFKIQLGESRNRVQDLERQLQIDNEAARQAAEQAKVELEDIHREARITERKLHASETEAVHLRVELQELRVQSQAEKLQQLMELDSVRKENQFKDAKLLAAENEAEQLRQEVQRLQASEVELNRRCHQYGEAVAEFESQKQTMEQLLQDNTRVIEEKAADQVELMRAVSDLKMQLRLKSEDFEKMRTEADSELQRVLQQLEQNELDLRQTHQRLEHAVNFVADIQSYSNRVDDDLTKTKARLCQAEEALDHYKEALQATEKRLTDGMKEREELQQRLARIQSALAGGSRGD